MVSLSHSECYLGSLTHCPQEKGEDIFVDYIFKCIFSNKMFHNLIQVSLDFVPKGAIYNKAA